MTNHNLLKWDGENPFLLDLNKTVNGCKLKRATEDDLLRVVDFIRSKEINDGIFGINIPESKRSDNLFLF